MAAKSTDTTEARAELAPLMRVCPASVRDGGQGHVIEFKEALAAGYSAIGNSRATLASLRAAAGTLRAFGD